MNNKHDIYHAFQTPNLLYVLQYKSVSDIYFLTYFVIVNLL